MLELERLLNVLSLETEVGRRYSYALTDHLDQPARLLLLVDPDVKHGVRPLPDSITVHVDREETIFRFDCLMPGQLLKFLAFRLPLDKYYRTMFQLRVHFRQGLIDFILLKIVIIKLHSDLPRHYRLMPY